jgi:hypothetical protein
MEGNVKTLISLFQGPNGDISSKRISAMALIISGIVLAFWKPDEVGMVGTLLGTGTGILGIQAITKT